MASPYPAASAMSAGPAGNTAKTCHHCSPPLTFDKVGQKKAHYRVTHQSQTTITSPDNLVQIKCTRHPDGVFHCPRGDCHFTTPDPTSLSGHSSTACTQPWPPVVPAPPAPVDPDAPPVYFQVSATAAALNQYAAAAAAVQQQQQQAPGGYAPSLFPSPAQALLPPPPGSTPQQQADYAAAAAAAAVGLPPSFDLATVAPPARPKRYFCRRCYPHLHFSSELDKKRHIDEFHDGRARNRTFPPGSAAATPPGGEQAKRKAGSEGPDTPEGSVNGDAYPAKKRSRLDVVSGGGGGGVDDDDEESSDDREATPQDPQRPYCANPPPLNSTPDEVGYDEAGRAYKSAYSRPPGGSTTIRRVYWDEMGGDAAMWNRPWGWQSQSAALRRGKDGIHIAPKSRWGQHSQSSEPPNSRWRQHAHSSEPLAALLGQNAAAYAYASIPAESTTMADLPPVAPVVSRRKSRAQPEKVVVLLDYPCPFCIVEPPCDFETEAELDSHIGAVHDWRAAERAARERKERRSEAASKPAIADAAVVVPLQGTEAVLTEAALTAETTDVAAATTDASAVAGEPEHATDTAAPDAAAPATVDAPARDTSAATMAAADEEEEDDAEVEVGPCEMCVPHIAFGNAAARDWHWKVAHQRLTRPPPGPPTPPPELVVDDSVKTETVPAVAIATSDSVPSTCIAGEAATPSQAQPLPTIISDGGGPGYGAVTTPGAASPLSTSFISSPSAENRKPRMSDLLNPTTTTTMAVVAPVAAAAPSPTPASAAIGQPVPQVDVSMPAGAAPAPVMPSPPAPAVIDAPAAPLAAILQPTPVEALAPAPVVVNGEGTADAARIELPVS